MVQEIFDSISTAMHWNVPRQVQLWSSLVCTKTNLSMQLMYICSLRRKLADRFVYDTHTFIGLLRTCDLITDNYQLFAVLTLFRGIDFQLRDLPNNAAISPYRYRLLLLLLKSDTRNHNSKQILNQHAPIFVNNMLKHICCWRWLLENKLLSCILVSDTYLQTELKPCEQ